MFRAECRISPRHPAQSRRAAPTFVGARDARQQSQGTRLPAPKQYRHREPRRQTGSCSLPRRQPDPAGPSSASTMDAAVERHPDHRADRCLCGDSPGQSHLGSGATGRQFDRVRRSIAPFRGWSLRLRRKPAPTDVLPKPRRFPSATGFAHHSHSCAVAGRPCAPAPQPSSVLRPMTPVACHNPSGRTNSTHVRMSPEVERLMARAMCRRFGIRWATDRAGRGSTDCARTPTLGPARSG